MVTWTIIVRIFKHDFVLLGHFVRGFLISVIPTKSQWSFFNELRHSSKFERSPTRASSFAQAAKNVSMTERPGIHSSKDLYVRALNPPSFQNLYLHRLSENWRNCPCLVLRQQPIFFSYLEKQIAEICNFSHYQKKTKVAQNAWRENMDILITTPRHIYDSFSGTD
jgi:hypothetical protein